MRSGMLMELSAQAFLRSTPPMVRKYAFLLIQAGQRYNRAGQVCLCFLGGPYGGLFYAHPHAHSRSRLWRGHARDSAIWRMEATSRLPVSLTARAGHSPRSTLASRSRDSHSIWAGRLRRCCTLSACSVPPAASRRRNRRPTFASLFTFTRSVMRALVAVATEPRSKRCVRRSCQVSLAGSHCGGMAVHDAPADVSASARRRRTADGGD